MRRIVPRLWLMAALLAIGCAEAPTGIDDPDLATLTTATSLTLYEGLPHQRYDKELLAEELRTKKTLEFHAFPFYVETLKLSQADRTELVAALSDADAFRPFRGEKTCGGFHPDYALVWSAAGEERMVLVCFGCNEIKVYGPAGERRYDIRDPRLKAVLRDYQKNRPGETFGLMPR